MKNIGFYTWRSLPCIHARIVPLRRFRFGRRARANHSEIGTYLQHKTFLVHCAKVSIICAIISFQHGGSLVSCMTFFTFFNKHAICFHEPSLSCDEWEVGFFELNFKHFRGCAMTRRKITVSKCVCPSIFFFLAPYELTWLLLCSFPINVRSEISFVFFNQFTCP